MNSNKKRTREELIELARQIPIYPETINLEASKIPYAMPICMCGNRKICFPFEDVKQRFIDHIDDFIQFEEK